MNNIRLSSKGQITIPKPLRTAYRWKAGQGFAVVDVGDGILLKPNPPFAETSINEVASCLKTTGSAKTLNDMETAIAKGVQDKFR